jgi:alpha-1,3-glucosyltransferase
VSSISLLMLQNATVIPHIFLLACIGVLLFPSYYSTDFDVHRNWLSITRHLPLREWYFDTQNGKTVHTLDYPPMFAYFEAFLSNNYITRNILEDKLTLVDVRCFQMLPDSDNLVTDNCIAFHRSTVIVSYAIYMIGAAYVAKVVSFVWHEKNKDSSPSPTAYAIIMTLLTFNPGLIFLDFVHFQYNGLLLGILLLSVGFITQAGIHPYRFIHHDILGAAAFAFLLGMKHLYLSLGPLYFTYLLRHYCFRRKTVNNKNNLGGNKMQQIYSTDGENSAIQFSLLRFFQLTLVTLVILFLPYIPIIVFTSSPTEQLKQIFSRLFPFGRGLVHEYWAGNIWAIYMYFSKCLRSLSYRGSFLLQTPFNDGLPDITPAVSAVLSLISLAPALFCAYKVAAISLQKPLQTPLFFLHATVSEWLFFGI